MKVVFYGATNFSFELASYLLSNNIEIAHFFTAPKEFSISYSDKPVINTNFADLNILANEHNIPISTVFSNKKKLIGEQSKIISSIKPEIILVMGWYYMIPKVIRDLAKYGAWGIHASLLPKYAGGAPLVWAMINGEEKTGISLFKLDAGVDDGDIICQKEVEIEYTDTIKEVYEKVTKLSKKVLLDSILNADIITPQPQDKQGIEVYPQRSPEDGEIDFSKPALEIYNFIRAQSDPYPGAFFRTADGKKIVIHKASIK